MSHSLLKALEVWEAKIFGMSILMNFGVEMKAKVATLVDSYCLYCQFEFEQTFSF